MTLQVAKAAADKGQRRREQPTIEDRKRTLKKKLREDREARELDDAHRGAKVVRPGWQLWHGCDMCSWAGGCDGCLPLMRGKAPSTLFYCAICTAYRPPACRMHSRKECKLTGPEHICDVQHRVSLLTPDPACRWPTSCGCTWSGPAARAAAKRRPTRWQWCARWCACPGSSWSSSCPRCRAPTGSRGMAGRKQAPRRERQAGDGQGEILGLGVEPAGWLVALLQLEGQHSLPLSRLQAGFD